QACAVWLSISPTLGTQNVGGQLTRWLKLVGHTNEVPMAFVYGKGDPVSSNASEAYLKAVRGVKPPPAVEALTGPKPVDTKLVGSALLTRSLRVDDWIINDYLTKVFSKRRARSVKREVSRYRFYYTLPGGRAEIAKRQGEKVYRVNVNLFFR